MKYAHTNLNVKNLEAVAAFYCEVLGCTPQGEIRTLEGDYIERLTGIPGVRLRAQNLLLPGYGSDGPMLELFAFAEPDASSLKRPNTFGFAHIAFEVEGLEAIVQVFGERGGVLLGEIMEKAAGEGRLALAYLKDIEGNVVELMEHRA